MRNWLRLRLRKWLGIEALAEKAAMIDELDKVCERLDVASARISGDVSHLTRALAKHTEMAVDVGFRDPTTIIIGKEAVIFEESDVPQPYKIGEKPPPKAEKTWAWAFLENGGVETIYLGFKTMQAALDDALAYRRSMLEDTGDEGPE